jgi:predicted alpha/beta superfamily hydrolase
MTFPKASIKGSETRVLHSKDTGMTYLVSVGMPHRYSDKSKKKWPVVYLIDSNLYFGMITDIIRSMSWCGMTSDALVVGVGYASDSPLDEAWHEVMARRYKDLTPIRDEDEEAQAREWLKREVRSGGAKEFHGFVETELIPTIESNYRVIPKTRTLAGHSFGGLFALFAMLTKPELLATVQF